MWTLMRTLRGSSSKIKVIVSDLYNVNANSVDIKVCNCKD